MKTTLVSFATPELRGLQEAQASSAIAAGGIDDVIAWDAPRLSQTAFSAQHRAILSQPRGSGYWLWKPFIILEALRQSQPGDVVVYYDVGRRRPHVFHVSIRPLVERCIAQGGLIPGVYIPLMGPSRRWTKRDCFILMKCDTQEYWDHCQVQATFSVWKHCPRALDFVEEWLACCVDPRILTDMPNECGEENFPDFIDHRHDQSVLTNLVVKHGIPCMGDEKRHAPFSKDINWAVGRVRSPLLCGAFDATYRALKRVRSCLTQSHAGHNTAAWPL
jgi:hypothetical protein